MNKSKQYTRERGIALLITLLVMSVLLGVSASLLNITLKQYQFSSIGLQSEVAFQAANAGMECILYHDYQGYPTSKFDVNGNNTGTAPENDISCFGQNSIDIVGGNGTNLPSGITPHAGQVDSGEEQRFAFVWMDYTMPEAPAVCTDVSIYKFYNTGSAQDMSSALGRAATCAADTVCTVIRSRGYNTECGNINSPRTIEREITQRY